MITIDVQVNNRDMESKTVLAVQTDDLAVAAMNLRALADKMDSLAGRGFSVEDL